MFSHVKTGYFSSYAYHMFWYNEKDRRKKISKDKKIATHRIRTCDINIDERWMCDFPLYSFIIIDFFLCYVMGSNFAWNATS